MVNEKRIKVSIIAFGILDIIFGLCLLPTFFIFLGAWFLFVLGILYLLFGFRVIVNSLRIRFLYYGIIPLTILSALFILLLSVVEQYVPLEEQIIAGVISVVILFSICLANLYFFTRPSVTAHFKTQSFTQKMLIYFTKGLVLSFIAFMLWFLHSLQSILPSYILFLAASIFFVILALYNILYLPAKEIITRKKTHKEE